MTNIGDFAPNTGSTIRQAYSYRLRNRESTISYRGKTVTTAGQRQATRGTAEASDGVIYRLDEFTRIPEHVERRNDELKALMDSHGLTVPQVAAMLGVSRYRVQRWRKPKGSASGFACSAERVEALQRAIKAALAA